MVAPHPPLSRGEREIAILPSMFFRKPARKPSRFVRRLITGLIIGGAIASVLGHKHRTHSRQEEQADKDE